MKLARNEYPRPQFRRDEWMSLNGEWEFSFDDNDEGKIKGWQSGKIALKDKILVPFAYQCAESGIGDETQHDIVWYRRKFTCDTDKHALLCFNASDYITDVWINGVHVIQHEGGYAPFKADITKYVTTGENVIVVRCDDDLDESVPRGKQSYNKDGSRFLCWYIPTTGIWQSVWIEYCGEDYIDEYSIVPNVDEGCVCGEIRTAYDYADEIGLKVWFNGNEVAKGKFGIYSKKATYSLSLLEHKTLEKLAYWYPHNPKLYHVEFVLYKNGEVVDKAYSRFGLRKISVENGQIYLNNRPLYQKLILDQGYWKGSGLTPPSVEALRKDIELCKAMGFNGARKHQKLEDPYWYYLADEMGFLTWCEMPSAYGFCDREVRAVSKEWQEIVCAAKNFTSVIAYAPMNESWGIRGVLTDKKQQDFAKALYYLTYAIDGTRLISTNDGWENVCPTDMVTIHDYAYDSSNFERYKNLDKYDTLNPAGKMLFAKGSRYEGQPILFSEFGGVMMRQKSDDGSWGYGKNADDKEEFYQRIDNLVKGIYTCPFQGYCYTQVSDVQQEKNGLLDENHEPKFSIERLAEIFGRDGK